MTKAPFGGTLSFIQDDSYYIPEVGGIKYYRYSFRRAGSGDDWTPIAHPLSRPYRMEYDDGTLPTSAPVSGSTPNYVEASSSVNGYNLAGGYYRREFTLVQLLDGCTNAAFAASLHVYGKATNGYWRLGYDAGRLIAFALARRT